MAEAAMAASNGPGADIVKDHIYITDSPELRVIAVNPAIPSAMARTGQWRVEDFDLHKELYRGKTSLLYMATDKKSGMQVALKLYRKRKLSTLNKYQVEREIRIHIQLDHVNIIKLFAAFEDEKHVYMVQEFAGGGDLFEDLKRNNGQMKEKYAVRDVIVPFINALQYLHGKGIIHRDIKPENILLTSQRVVKIADFGLSINFTQERPVTRAGTLDYMAPEVLICPDKRRPEENKDKVLLAYTAQVDAWAVGILCYELLVGCPPFEQESRAATYEHIMYKEPKFPSWMSDDAKRFISAALCKNAVQRPTVADLAKQPLVLTYAAPVPAEKEPERGHELLIERSARSVIMGPGTPLTAASLHAARMVATSTGSGGNTPTAGMGDRSLSVDMESVSSPSKLVAAGGSSGSADPPSSPVLGKREMKPSSSMSVKVQNMSGMVIDEDASYTPGEIARSMTADLSSSSIQRNSPAPPLSKRPSHLGSKSRLGVSSTNGAGSSSTGVTPSAFSLPLGKVSPLAMLNQVAAAGGMARLSQVSDAGALVEKSSGSYYKPQGGVLSDDSSLPVTRSGGSLSGLAALQQMSLQNGSVGASSGKRAPFGMERPTLTQLQHAGEEGSHAEESEQKSGSSKYGKLFAKMWGGSTKSTTTAADIEPFKVESSKGSLSSGVAGSGPSLTRAATVGVSKKAGPLRNLQEELLAEREQSVVLLDRTGSVIGAPTMTFKQPTPQALQAMRAAAASAAESKPVLSVDPRQAILNPGLRVATTTAQMDLGGLQRLNSEAVMQRPGVDRGVGRSFTTVNSPTMAKRLENAPIVSKIQQYVQQK